MKRGWGLVPFKEACPVVARKPIAFSGPRAYYATGAVDEEGNLAEPDMVAFKSRPSRANCMPLNGDVGFARMKGTRKVVMVDEHLDRRLFSTGFCFLEPQQTVEPQFLRFYLRSEAFQRAKDQISGDGIMGGARNGDIEQLFLPLPPKDEQQRIVAILDEAFESIAAAQNNADRSRQKSVEVFGSHLQALFSAKGTGWRQMRLPDVATTFARGKSRHRPRNDPRLYNGPFPFIQTGDISNANHWLADYAQTYSEQGLAQSRMWPKGTVCIAIVGATVGESAILGFDACFPDSVIGIVTDDRLADNEYVEFLLQAYKALLKEKGKGTARDNINLGCFEDQLFPFPPLQEQKRIVTQLNAINEHLSHQLACCERKLAALVELKASLLHQAFTGQL